MSKGATKIIIVELRGTAHNARVEKGGIGKNENDLEAKEAKGVYMNACSRVARLMGGGRKL